MLQARRQLPDDSLGLPDAWHLEHRNLAGVQSTRGHCAASYKRPSGPWRVSRRCLRTARQCFSAAPAGHSGHRHGMESGIRRGPEGPYSALRAGRFRTIGVRQDVEGLAATSPPGDGCKTQRTKGQGGEGTRLGYRFPEHKVPMTKTLLGRPCYYPIVVDGESQ